MSNVAVIGAQWGDEGKGKIVDWLSEKADVVVRFQGGHNAGHTLVVNKITYKLKLLPSGVIRKNKISIIGNGVVIDPWALLDEIEQIKNLGIKIFLKRKIRTKNTHGTGCTLSSALATCLSQKKNIVKSCKISLKYVNRAIVSAPGYGKGFGPLNHLVSFNLKNTNV